MLQRVALYAVPLPLYFENRFVPAFAITQINLDPLPISLVEPCFDKPR